MANESNAAVATELLPQRWICLVAMIVAIFFMQMALIMMAGVASTIMVEMSMTPSQFGMLANMPYLCGVLFGIVLGNLGDRVGIKKLLNISMAAFVIGAFWRWLAVGSYPMLMVSSLVMGFGIAALNANSTKGIRLWFPGKALGPAMGMYIAGASLGAGVALQVGPILGTSSSLLLAAVCSLISWVVWIACYRNHPAEFTSGEASGVEKGAFGRIIKSKDVWIVAIMMFFVFGCSTTYQTYMVAGLNSAAQAIGNMDAATLCGTMSLVSTVFVAAASIFMPAILTRVKNLRMVMIVVCLLTALFTFGTLWVPFGILTWCCIIIQSFGLGSMLAMGKTVPALIPGLDPRNLGAVGGLQSTFQNLGGWVIAGYIIAPIAQGIIGPTGVDSTGAAVYGLGCYQGIFFGALISACCVALCYLLLNKNVKGQIQASDEEAAA